MTHSKLGEGQQTHVESEQSTGSVATDAIAESDHRRRHRLDRDSRTWLDGLSGAADRRERKLAELHDLMRRAARHEVARRRGWAGGPGSKDREDLVEDIACDALLLVVHKLGTYRGESRFTTWVYAFVMNVTSRKLARQAARSLLLTMEEQDWDRLPDRMSADPHHLAELGEILGALRSAVEQKLTERQRHVFVAVALNEVAIDELAEQLGANRNAIYKTLFVARRKLRVHLEDIGYRIPTTLRAMP